MTVGAKPKIFGSSGSRLTVRLILAALFALHWAFAGGFPDARQGIVPAADTARLEPSQPATPFLAPRDGALPLIREDDGRRADPASGADHAAVNLPENHAIPDRTGARRDVAPVQVHGGSPFRPYDPRAPPLTA